MITPRGSLFLVIFKCDVELCEIITTNATRCVFVCFNWTTSGFMTGTSATTFSAEVEVTIICSSVVAIMELTLCHCFTTLRCHYRPNEVHLRNYHKHDLRLQRRCQHCHNDHTVLHNDHRVIHNRHIHNCNMQYSHSNSRNTNISGMGHSQMNIHNSHNDSAWDVVGSLDSNLHSWYGGNPLLRFYRNGSSLMNHLLGCVDRKIDDKAFAVWLVFCRMAVVMFVLQHLFFLQNLVHPDYHRHWGSRNASGICNPADP